jgi:hypothetical protein
VRQYISVRDISKFNINNLKIKKHFRDICIFRVILGLFVFGI